MDGTLTRAIHDFNAIRQRLDLPHDQGILEALELLPEPQRVHKRTLLDQIEADLARQTNIAPGVHGFLSYLQAQQKRLGILTRNSHANALLTLQTVGLAEFFDPADIIARDEAAPKPDPAGILHLMQRWQVHGDQAVMVGDFRDDFIAGKRAGVHTIYVDYADSRQWQDFCHQRVTNLMELIL